MKNYKLKRLGLLSLATLFIFLCAPFAINAQFDKGEVTPFEREAFNVDEEKELQMPQYVPGEVLVKFKEGVDPQSVRQEVNVEVTNIERIHSIKSVVARFKKDYKLEKNEDGRYWFKGKSYKEIENIPDEQIFQEAYNEMSPLRQELYRKYRVTLGGGKRVEDVLERLRNNPNIEYVHPNYLLKIDLVPDDPRFYEQWALNNTGQLGGTPDADIDALEAWDITEGSPDIAIAIIDTGVDYNHEDLAANIWINLDEIPDNDIDDDKNGYIDDYRGYDFVSIPEHLVWPGEDPAPPDNDPIDFHGHGTHVAGIAAAVKDNGIGIAGVAPRSKIMAIRAGFLAGSGIGYLLSSDIEQAILYAIDNGVEIINMSFSGGSAYVYQEEIEIAYAENIVLVAAAGNSNTSVEGYPASMGEVISVAATDENDQRSIWGPTSASNYGPWIDVAAPGTSILSTIPDNAYSHMSGTSMACPQVAGIAALILAQNAQLSPEEVRRRIQLLSDDLGPLEKDIYFGYGRVNAHRSAVVDDFSVSITSPANESYIRGTIDILGNAFVLFWNEDIFERYELYFASKDNPEEYIAITSSANPVPDGVLGTWDTTSYLDAEYILTLKGISVGDIEIPDIQYVTIDNYNQAPVFIIPPTTVGIVDRLLELKVDVYHPDDPETPEGQLEFYADNLPLEAQFNPQTQILSWQPSDFDRGVYEVSFSAMDNEYTVTKDITLITLAIEKTQISTDVGYQSDGPAIYQDRIVWGCARNGNQDIYMYDLSTGQETQITTDPAYQNFPSIYEDKVVWEDKRNGTFNEDIYMYDLSTGQETQITTDPEKQRFPSIYRDKIVWEDWRNGNPDIYMYDLSTGQETQITTDPEKQQEPVIYENKIIWVDSRNGYWDIYMHNLSAGQETRITPNSSSSWCEYAIYQDKIVWENTQENGIKDIYMYDLSTGQVTQITTDLFSQNSPSIYEDKVVWVDERNNEGPDTYMYDLSTGQETQITTDSISQKYPSIYQNKIVWIDREGGDWDVCLAKLFYAPQIISLSTTEVSPGDILTLTGINLGYSQEDSQVRFANGAVAPVEDWSNVQITCIVPVDAQTGLLRVITPGGESNGIMVEVSQPNQPPQMVYLRNLWNRYLIWQGDDPEDAHKLRYSYKVDQGKWSKPKPKRWVSVKQLKKKLKLRPGRHIFAVKAIDREDLESEVRAIKLYIRR